MKNGTLEEKTLFKINHMINHHAQPIVLLCIVFFKIRTCANLLIEMTFVNPNQNRNDDVLHPKYVI